MGYIGVIVEEPPRHGKSELCSHYTPAWFTGTLPDKRVILVSYESSFAATWGRKARDTMQEYGAPIFGVDVNPRSNAADRWDIKGHRGGMYTAGALGGITGRGADLLIADDMIKNQTDAMSEILRDRTHEEWKNTYRTRLEPGGVIFVVGTRWHEDDIIGRLLAVQGQSSEGENHPLYDEDGDRYLRVRLPAIAEEPDEEFPDPDPLGREPGEALFPQRFPVSALRPLMGTTTWEALYQQRPTPKEGGLFNPANFDIVPEPDIRTLKKIVRRWDTAATDEKEADDPDYTVGCLLAEDALGTYYVLDVVRVRLSPEGTEATIRQVTMADRLKFKSRVKFTMEQEPGSQGKLYIRSVAKRLFKGSNFRGIRSTGSKMMRADLCAAASERKEIKLVRGKWNKPFLHELKFFPRGAHDDQVDALSGAFEDLTGRKGTVSTW
jgi:predicted phage terminase large subunit-like protein